MRVIFLVVEDEDMVARAMERVLSPFGETCLAASVSDAQRQLALRCDWTAFFIDLNLPDGSGLEVLGQVRAEYPTAPVMVLTGATDQAAINAAFDLDAEYVVKPVQQARIVKFLVTHQDFGARLDRTIGAWRSRYTLSDAEADVLRRAALGETRDEIAAARECSVLTVKTHVTNLLQKTGDASLHAAVGRLLRATAGDPRAD
ncbi:MAG TPA: response regulator transcription factor [Polyangiaceae bacterium]